MLLCELDIMEYAVTMENTEVDVDIFDYEVENDDYEVDIFDYEVENDDYEDNFDEVGFNPYMGCYDYDC